MTVLVGKKIETDFDTAWAAAQKIPGWLSQREARLLWSAATMIPADGLIVEVGSYCGRSATLLAHAGRPVVCIDPLVIGEQASKKRTISQEDVASLQAVVDRYPNVTWLRCGAAELIDSDGIEDIELLYIDGDHKGSAPLDDFKTLEKRLAQFALVAYHDFPDERGVSRAIATLERSGTVTQLESAGSLYVGQCVYQKAKDIRVLLARPSYGPVHRASYVSERSAVKSTDSIDVHTIPAQSSLLAHGFNDCVVTCNKRGGYEYLAMLHADVSCSVGFISTMVGLINKYELEVLHAVVPIKNSTGITSTAFAYSDDMWAAPRRLTMKELHKLPPTFTADIIREHYDPNVKAILPNTGCLLVRAGTWLEDFPGFAILDRIRKTEDTWESECVPEDWHFGYWCAANRISVGGTREVVTRHWGEQCFPSNECWGDEIDKFWVREQEQNGHLP